MMWLTAEKEESEYQWGVAKARLAQTESDKLAAQAEANVLSNVAAQLKALLVKQAKGGAVKGLTFDRVEQRAYDALEVG
jgi:hypothetical protein